MTNLEQWYFSIPVITRTFLTLSTITSFAVTFDLLNPLQLYLNFQNVFFQYQFWRLATNFLFFDRFSINFILHLYFLYFYCRRLEEHSFHRKTGDFFYLILFGCVMMLCISPLLQLPFMSHALVIMLLYIWSRRNPHEQFRIYGIFTVGAGYLAWVLLGVGLLMGMSPVVDLVGIAVGHIYFYLKDVIPGEFDGVDPLKTPLLISKLFPGDHDLQAHPPVYRDPQDFFDVDQNEEEERMREHQADLREENNQPVEEIKEDDVNIADQDVNISESLHKRNRADESTNVE
ncbi:predicted protein [Naegleria gruberi]|uniref:Derlin n=1 Tax=Naegleria gruberi TaxID=5762 RepID=D2VD83_NAEGR|nr:uncharacterized protein NAEGRDRAFT_33077 [Naegleria gruberi]EFC45285.1 predicted protein [Naegleria gruberi]|eukprot:XP_002678029.1 predicted protein [Naegleria gruberi strain NEG-M]